MKKARIKVLAERMDAIVEELRELQFEAQETFSSRSDDWQESDKGIEAEDRIGGLEMAIDEIENGVEALTNAMDED